MKFLTSMILCLGLIGNLHAANAKEAAVTAKVDIGAQVGRIYATKVTLPDGKAVRISMDEGKMATIKIGAEGRGIGLVPMRSDTHSSDVRFKIFKIGANGGKNESAAFVATVTISTEYEGTYSNDGMDFKIELLTDAADPVAISHSPASENSLNSKNVDACAGIQRPQSEDGTGGCCVTCGSVTACGRKVEHDCGSCGEY